MDWECAGKMVQRALKSGHVHRELNRKELAVGGKSLPAERTTEGRNLRGRKA